MALGSSSLAVAFAPFVLAEPSAVIALSPFETPRNHFLTAAVLVPGIEAAAPIEEGRLYVRARTAHSKSVEIEREHGLTSRANGLLHEWISIDLAYAITEHLEIGTRATFAGWDEKDDIFDIRGRSGRFIVRDEQNQAELGKTARHENVSEWILRAKLALLRPPDPAGPSALSVALQVRLPIARQRDITHAGTTEASLSLLGTLALSDALALHANAGAVAVFGEQQIFVEDAEIQPYLHGAIGATWRPAEAVALGVHLEGNGPAFRHVDLMDRPAFSVGGGVRFLPGALVIEVGGAAGLVRQAADWEVYASFGLVVF